jgi:O-acetyl-ADP-ribose deacetylase (regulator of RNase III)
MITCKSGNIFESKCEIKTNPVNSVGVMGKGLPLTFKKKYPEECRHYNDYCLSYQMNYRKHRLMVPMLYKEAGILMFPTKIHWLNPSEYSFISDGLDETKSLLIKNGSPSVAFPALGCGLGGLDFQKVLDMIERVYYDYTNTVEVYRPE